MKYPAGMCNVMVPPGGTLVAGVNTRTGATAASVTWVATVMDVKAIIDGGELVHPGGEVCIAVVPIAIPGASKASEREPSQQPTQHETNWKPPTVTARPDPRVSPVSVMVIAAVPVATPAVVRTRVVLTDDTVAEVAVKSATVLAMEVTDPKK